MAYVVNTPEQQKQMLQRIGVDSLEDLLAQIPAALQLQRPLDLPPALTEMELEQHLRQRAAQGGGVATRISFLGGGVSEHFIPAVVDEIAQRNEFYTAYTPYQAEASQGSLQAFFEFQSLLCDLTGLPVANASLYDGASAAAEAALMAMRVTDRRQRVVIAGAVHPEWIAVVRTYLHNLGCEVVQSPVVDGAVDLAQLESLVNSETAAVLVQSPNFLGVLEDVPAVCELARRHGSLAIVGFHPLSLGLLKRPGDCGADIAIAEGQPLGIPLQFGGPYLGLLACREEHVRKLPGRLIGQTVDRRGTRCFVLNLQTREQHIRREKATSNICTNQGLMALRAAVYLALLGPQGLREAAGRASHLAHHAAEQLATIPGVKRLTSQSFFHEFALVTADVAGTVQRLGAHGFDIGPRLDQFPAIPGLSAADQQSSVLIAITECRTVEQIDRLVELLRS